MAKSTDVSRRRSGHRHVLPLPGHLAGAAVYSF
jgi:hypothetical protein